MDDTRVTLVGNLGGNPELGKAGDLQRVTMRLAVTPRYQSRGESGTDWKDGDTSWYRVVAFGPLAEHAAASLKSGNRVIVVGRLNVRTWQHEDKHGTSVELAAEAIGPDLRWGTTEFTRSGGPTTTLTEEQAAAEAGIEPAEPTSEAPADAWALPGDEPELVGAGASTDAGGPF